MYSFHPSIGPLIVHGRSRKNCPSLRKTWTRALPTAAIVMLFALSAAGQPIQSGASPGSNRVTFSESVKEVVAIPGAALVRSELAPAEAQATLDFSVALKMHKFAELQNRVARGEIISLDEIASKYYPTADEYKTVAAWLSSQGFAIKPADKYNLSIFASGTVAQMERVFAAKFGRVKFHGVEYTSALSAPSLPAEVAAPVLGINGLQPHLHPTPALIKLPSPLQKAISNQPPYTVSEIAKAYGANSTSTNGSGQKIGIVIDTFPNDSDLTAFWQFNGVNQSLNNIEKIQVVGGALPSPSGEETLDVEWSSGIASGAKVRVYATTDLYPTHLDQAYQAIINDLPSQPGLRQVSMSFAGGEANDFSQSQLQTDAQYFATMAAAGVTPFAASGDWGPFDPSETTVTVNYPASDPSVTGVGGTSLYLDASTGAVSNETAWSWNFNYNWGTGGGISKFFSRPSWQIGPGVLAGSTRLVPDVAVAADPLTGAVVYLNGGQTTIGGTSWSSPTWAGICAKINQARANAGLPSVGLLGPKIYPLIGSSNFRDITTGTNGPNGFYNAGPGYDLCTGIGVPLVDTLIQTLGAPPTPLTGQPGVITFSTGGYQQIYAFVSDANGNLDVNYWTGSAWRWADQGLPPGTTASDSPGVIGLPTVGTQLPYAFVTGANGHLDVNYSVGWTWRWADQGLPPGTTASGVPGVITYSAGGAQLIYAFVRGANGHLCVNYWNGSAWNWADQGLPPGTTVSSAPGVLTYSAGGTQRPYAFVTGANGHLYVNYWYGSGWAWADQGLPPGTTASGAPAVITYSAGGTQVIYAFVRGANGHLYVNYWYGSGWAWADQGLPPGTTASGVPGVITYSAGGTQLPYVFVTGANGHLDVNYWNGLAWHWADQGLPPGTMASGAPGVINYLAGGTQLPFAFVPGANGHLDVNYWNGSAWLWADQGLVP
jgi:kumamolisin